jgi:Na+-driven multidrug efflux pump
LGKIALRIIAIHFPLAAVGIVCGSIFQAFGKSFYSLIVSLGRQLFILIPAAYLLSLTGNVNNVWWSFLIAELVSLILSIMFFKKIYREEVKPLENK